MKFCSNCGAELMDEAVICPKCGCPAGKTERSRDPGANKSFCTHCGAEMDPSAAVCMNCGCAAAGSGASSSSMGCT